MIKDNKILEILKLKNIAVVGASIKIDRPSYFVSLYMLQNGYKIFPVNPSYNKIFNLTCYPNLESIKPNIDIVNIFRKSNYVLPIVSSAIKKKVKAIWMQDGVINHEAKKLAKNAGIQVVMDKCLLREHRINHKKLI
tara:strand:- start:152 stop:562 length:411 start_codon:yes stop_codon:yes gene_type:complete